MTGLRDTQRASGREVVERALGTAPGLQQASRQEQKAHTGVSRQQGALWPEYPQGTLPKAEASMAFPLLGWGSEEVGQGDFATDQPQPHCPERIVSQRGPQHPPGSTQISGLPSDPPPAHKPVSVSPSQTPTPRGLLTSLLTHPQDSLPSGLFKSHRVPGAS